MLLIKCCQPYFSVMLRHEASPTTQRLFFLYPDLLILLSFVEKHDFVVKRLFRTCRYFPQFPRPLIAVAVCSGFNQCGDGNFNFNFDAEQDTSFKSILSVFT